METTTRLKKIRLRRETISLFSAGAMMDPSVTISGECHNPPNNYCTDGCGGTFETVTDCGGRDSCDCSACTCATEGASCDTVLTGITCR